MKKHPSAVEFLEDKLMNHPYGGVYFPHNTKELFEQAKEMEKQGMIDFAFDFYYDFSNQLGVPFNLISENRLNAEQYYNETFKSE